MGEAVLEREAVVGHRGHADPDEDANVSHDGSWDRVDGTTTGPDGTYAISGLPAASHAVHFSDCTGGQHVGIWVQASTDSQFGGLTRTDSSGDYTVTLAVAGSFCVQFVDCRDTPSFAGQWWYDQPMAARAALVPVSAGQTVPGVDAKLDPGAEATISGRVTSLRGAAVTSACVVAYLPDQYALFAPVAADGTYTIPGVPSGTYAVAALGCPQGVSDPSPIASDPSVAGVRYQALWWHQVPLVFDQKGDGGPDPIAQHVNFVAVTSGATVGDRDSASAVVRSRSRACRNRATRSRSRT